MKNCLYLNMKMGSKIMFLTVYFVLTLVSSFYII